jgi:NADH-quinone oxidoreductase subunit L
VIHATHQQEVEHLGGLWRKLPVTALTFTVGAAALAGIVPLAGFWSKDEILLEAFEGNTFVYVVLAGTAALTALYSTRLVLLTFAGRPRDLHAYEHAHESGPVMLLPLLVLAGLATVAGFVAFDGIGRLLGFAGGIGQVVVSHGTPHPFEFHPNIAWPATIIALLAVGAGFAYWGGSAARAERARQWAPELHSMLVNRYYIDQLYQAVIDRVILAFAGVVARFDKAVVNESGVDGGAQTLNWLGFRLKFLQTGRIPNYALGMALGVLVLSIVALSGGE